MKEDTFQHTRKKDDTRMEYIPGNIDLEFALSTVENNVRGAVTRKVRDRRGEISINRETKDLVIMELKKMGYDHFVALSCIDHPVEKIFSLVYHLWSYGAKALVLVKTDVPRDAPAIGSIVGIFRPAITYEREIHEMFGVDFPGNPRLTQFILEDWDGPPPMRKDFDSISYSQDTYEMKVRFEKSLPPGLGKRGDDV